MKFYQVGVDPKDPSRFRLYYGEKAGKSPECKPHMSYASVGAAKRDCIQRFKSNPVRVDGDEIAYSPRNSVHAALQALEDKYTGCQVVAVGSSWYVIRRSRLGPEVRVKYYKTGLGIEARGEVAEPPGLG